MQLALNIELTDEQYTLLMSKSLDTILDTDTVQDAIANGIVKNIGSYLASDPKYIRDFIEPGYYQCESDKYRAIVKKVFGNAVLDYQASVSKAVTSYMNDLLTKVDTDKLMQNILHEVLVSSTLSSVRDALQKDLENIWFTVGRTQMTVEDLASRLSINTNLY